jgi:hypothetical protein
MTRREFERRYQHLDALSLGPLYRAYLVLKYDPHEWQARDDLLVALDRFEESAVRAEFGARRQASPPPVRPVAAPVP